MSSKEIVDLTDDNDPGPVQPPLPQKVQHTVSLEEKRRELPSNWKQAPTSSSAANANDPYARNMQVRTSQVKVPGSLGPNPQAPRPFAPPLTSNYAPRPAPAPYSYEPLLKVTFKLVNVREFTARVESGKVSVEVIYLISQMPGARFDWIKRKWLFPLKIHDNLQVALSRKKCFVESIPREVLIAAQFSAQKQLSGSNIPTVIDIDDTGTPSVTEHLSKHIPAPVMKSLAIFQQEAVEFILNKEGRALVADEMGLGKTRTAIGAACAYRDDLPALVVCPSSARHHWQSELLTVLAPASLVSKEQILLLETSLACRKYKKVIRRVLKSSKNKENQSGSTSSDSKHGDGNADGNIDENESEQKKEAENESGDVIKFIIISYSLLVQLHDILEDCYFDLIIVDESHYMKSKDAKRTKVLLPMIIKAKRAILLSGTPALSRPLELFTQLHALYPKQWADLKAYGKRYCVDINNKNKKKSLANSHNRHNHWGDNNYKGANNLHELHILLTASVMIRRLKKDILKHLPVKKRYLVRIEVKDLEQRQKLVDMMQKLKDYEELTLKKKNEKKRKKLKKGEDDNDKQNIFAAEKPEEETEEEKKLAAELKAKEKALLMQLYKLSGRAKLPAIVEKLDEFLAKEQNGKVLVFAHHVEVLKALSQFLAEKEVGYIYIDGSVCGEDRFSLTSSFQTDPTIRVAVLGITAAGIALTLTAASTVFFAELYWTPAALLQAEDRAHRIGQLNRVEVFYYLAQDSVDDLLWPLIRKKMQVLGEVVEGSSGDMEIEKGVKKKGSEGKKAKDEKKEGGKEEENKGGEEETSSVEEGDGEEDWGSVKSEGRKGMRKRKAEEIEGGEEGLGNAGKEGKNSDEERLGDEGESEESEERDKPEETEEEEDGDDLQDLAKEIAIEDKDKHKNNNNGNGSEGEEEGGDEDKSKEEEEEYEEYLKREEEGADLLARYYIQLYPQLQAHLQQVAQNRSQSSSAGANSAAVYGMAPFPSGVPSVSSAFSSLPIVGSNNAMNYAVPAAGPIPYNHAAVPTTAHIGYTAYSNSDSDTSKGLNTVAIADTMQNTIPVNAVPSNLASAPAPTRPLPPLSHLYNYSMPPSSSSSFPYAHFSNGLPVFSPPHLSVASNISTGNSSTINSGTMHATHYQSAAINANFNAAVGGISHQKLPSISSMLYHTSSHYASATSNTNNSQSSLNHYGTVPNSAMASHYSFPPTHATSGQSTERPLNSHVAYVNNMNNNSNSNNIPAVPIPTHTNTSTSRTKQEIITLSDEEEDAGFSSRKGSQEYAGGVIDLISDDEEGEAEGGTGGEDKAGEDDQLAEGESSNAIADIYSHVNTDKEMGMGNAEDVFLNALA